MAKCADVSSLPVHPERYGPVNCNVAHRMNGTIPPLNCERCTKGNGGPFQSSAKDMARGCLFYNHGDTGFYPKPEFERSGVAGAYEIGSRNHEAADVPIPKLSDDTAGEPFPKIGNRNDEVSESVPESLRPFVKAQRDSKRVQRARLLDVIEAALHRVRNDPHAVIEKETEQLHDEITAIVGL